MHSSLKKNHEGLLLIAFGLFAFSCLPQRAAQAGEPDQLKQVAPPAEEAWSFKLGVPGWLAEVSGNVGIRKTTSQVDVGVVTILKHLDMTAAFGAEARKGKFGIEGDFLYVSDSVGVGRTGLLSKVDLRFDQYLADLEGSYRLIDCRRGWLDLRAGVRYTNLYNRVILHPDDGAIEQASVRFVDETSKFIARELRRLIRGEESILPIPPLTEEVRQKALELILAAKSDPALAAALKARVKSRIEEAKARVANKIANDLKQQLNQTLRLSEDWFDPYVGLAARYNLSKAFYLIGRSDAGGFGVGSKFTYKAYGALGCQITRNIFSEAGYRYLYVDYQQNGFIYDIAQQGALITLGVNF